MSAKVARLTIDISLSEHRKIKTAATMMGTTIKNFMLMSVEDFMQRKLNKVTEKALKLSVQGKGLKKFKSLDELFEDLGV